jgi:hypothetical protein
MVLPAGWLATKLGYARNHRRVTDGGGRSFHSGEQDRGVQRPR